MFRYQTAIYSFFVGLLLHACTAANGVYKIIEDTSSTEAATNKPQADKPQTDPKSQPKECSICLEPFSDTDPEVWADKFHNFHETCMLLAMLAEYNRETCILQALLAELAEYNPTNESGILRSVTTEIEFHCPICRGKVTNQSLCTQVKREILLKIILKAIDIAVQAGGDLNATRDEDKNTLLHLVVEKEQLLAKKEQLEIIKKLIEGGAKLDVLNRRGRTPLHTASKVGATDVMELLLDHGADKDALDEFSCTPLHVASKYNQVESICLLIKRGANIEAEANQDYEVKGGRFRPLHLAVWFAQQEAIEALVANKANINAQTPYGFTPLHLTALCAKVDAADFIKRKYPDEGDRIAKDVMEYQARIVEKVEKHRACIDFLIKNSADPTIKDVCGRTYQEV